MLAGTACSYEVVAEGKRQIVSFHLAGDAPDLQSLHLDGVDISIGVRDLQDAHIRAAAKGLVQRTGMIGRKMQDKT
jgi:hypothetical protein